MIITENTKISSLIKHNPQVIDRISVINKNFKKLRNPVLRKILAGRISIIDAAKIGNTDIKSIIKAIEGLGFEYKDIFEKDNFNTSSKKLKMNNLKNAEKIDLDVRPILEQGVDPFQKIMETLKDMPEHKVLHIINTFEPIPLINKLKSDGYVSYVEREDNGLVHCYLMKGNQQQTTPKPETKNTEADFDDKKKSFGNNIKIIDVRELEMPEPMVVILQEIEKIREGSALYVHHKKIPQFLLPELEQRGFTCLQKEIEQDNVKLLIYK
ncbi:MAG: DUF2249 domain-containing protein [Chlorobi bacterium]|nr:DUF2249 domain-containing protein [Chlorobiota bacterium]